MWLEIQQQLKGSATSSLSSSSSHENISVDALSAGAYSALKSLTKEIILIKDGNRSFGDRGEKIGKQKGNDKRGRKGLRNIFIALIPIQNGLNIEPQIILDIKSDFPSSPEIFS